MKCTVVESYEMIFFFFFVKENIKIIFLRKWFYLTIYLKLKGFKKYTTIYNYSQATIIQHNMQNIQQVLYQDK